MLERISLHHFMVTDRKCSLSKYTNTGMKAWMHCKCAVDYIYTLDMHNWKRLKDVFHMHYFV